MDALKGITFPAGLDETPLADGGKVTCCFETAVGTELFQSANDGLECWADGGGWVAHCRNVGERVQHR
jgi:hypothetical protein